jgi:uncharacterized SAM-binding protein YcdF (DUF218 family)
MPSSRVRQRRETVRHLGRLFGIALGIVLMGGLAYVALTVAQVWWASIRDDAGDGRTADAIVVMGAAQWDGQPSPVFQQRLDHAVQLHATGVAPVIVVTGGKQSGDRVTQGLAAYDYLRTKGLPDEAILVEVDGRDTWTELSATAGILQSTGRGNSVVLVTDGYHALRASLVAEELGLEATRSPSSRGIPSNRLLAETGAVALGRLLGFGRLSGLT